MSEIQSLSLSLLVLLVIMSIVGISSTLARRAEESEPYKDLAWFSMFLFGSLTCGIVSVIFLIHYAYSAAKGKRQSV